MRDLSSMHEIRDSNFIVTNIPKKLIFAKFNFIKFIKKIPRVDEIILHL